MCESFDVDVLMSDTLWIKYECAESYASIEVSEPLD